MIGCVRHTGNSCNAHLININQNHWLTLTLIAFAKFYVQNVNEQKVVKMGKFSAKILNISKGNLI